MPKAKKPLTHCLVPDCAYDAKTRGLCNNHYNAARKLVESDQTSWEVLEKKGKAVFCKGRGHVQGWFLADK